VDLKNGLSEGRNSGIKKESDPNPCTLRRTQFMPEGTLRRNVVKDDNEADDTFSMKDLSNSKLL